MPWAKPSYIVLLEDLTGEKKRKVEHIRIFFLIADLSQYYEL